MPKLISPKRTKIPSFISQCSDINNRHKDKEKMADENLICVAAQNGICKYSFIKVDSNIIRYKPKAVEHKSVVGLM